MARAELARRLRPQVVAAGDVVLRVAQVEQAAAPGGCVLCAHITDEDRHNILHRTAERLLATWL